MLEFIFEIIFIDLLGGVLKFLLKILSLVILWVKNMGRKSVKEIWSDTENINFSGLNFVTQILTIILILLIIFIIVSLLF